MAENDQDFEWCHSTLESVGRLPSRKRRLLSDVMPRRQMDKRLHKGRELGARPRTQTY